MSDLNVVVPVPTTGRERQDVLKVEGRRVDITAAESTDTIVELNATPPPLGQPV